MFLNDLTGKFEQRKEQFRNLLSTETVRKRLADFFCEASVLAFVLGILEMVVANFNAPVKLTVRQFLEVFAVSSGVGAAFFVVGCTIELRLAGKSEDTK